MTAIPGIKRRLAYQTVYPGFGAQPAIGVFALKLDSCALDSGHFARRHFDQLGVKTVTLAPSKIHPQQHFGPILRLGTARSGLNIEKRVARVHFPGEHTLKLELGKIELDFFEIATNFGHCILIVLIRGKRQQLKRFPQIPLDSVQFMYRILELRALATQVLGALWLLPNCRILQLARYLDETFVFGVVVKDTPSAHPGASASPLFV